MFFLDRILRDRPSGLVTAASLAAVALLGRPFDPYPFVLPNLVLSCLAAIQAPITP